MRQPAGAALPDTLGQSHLPQVTMPPSSLRTLTCVSVAFLIAAACTSCTSLFDTDKLEDQAAGDGGEVDAAPGEAADAGEGDDGGDDGGEPMLDAGEPDAAPAECGPEGQSCNEEDPFFECNTEGECAECGRERDQPCCLTAPRCDDGILGLACVNNICL